MNAHGIPKHRQLPDKEAKLFKEVLVGINNFFCIAPIARALT